MNWESHSEFFQWWVIGMPLCWVSMIVSLIIDHAVMHNKDDISLGQVILFACIGAIPIFQYIVVFFIGIWLLFDVAPKIKIYKARR